ncbi:SDR family NAD(P)-dependent oxidoreductase [Actinokineospora cianjurensis]|uniref:Gluconate 5-dehydrogenase n=1 Tax=Actinokineospora cianjurensis TaxID=585224 RepID=A0A421B5C8_9PSEU|nr:SDR family oxidoreductase [Actinokineospora cianjurensis]RLK59515.1 gluconate 5-dehydrogenase [Actinokineospora cianjurensis]
MSAYLDQLFSLAGRRAVVTGGNSGIGRGMALALGRAGAEVVVVARREDALRETVEELLTIGKADWISADLSDRAEVHRVADEVIGRHGAPDILVNAAAVNLRPPMDELTEADWDLTLRANLEAPFVLGQRFGPLMAEAGWGRIINVTSQQAIRAFGNSGAYGAAKAGLAGLTRSQAEAWSSRGVCVNSVAPGFVRTPLTENVYSSPAQIEGLAARTMVGRNGEVSDFAGAVVFLASPAAAYVTGQMLFVDGGFSAK